MFAYPDSRGALCAARPMSGTCNFCTLLQKPAAQLRMCVCACALKDEMDSYADEDCQQTGLYAYRRRLGRRIRRWPVVFLRRRQCNGAASACLLCGYSSSSTRFGVGRIGNQMCATNALDGPV